MRKSSDSRAYTYMHESTAKSHREIVVPLCGAVYIALALWFVFMVMYGGVVV